MYSGVLNVQCGGWSVKCGMWSIECGVLSVECGVWYMEYGVCIVNGVVFFSKLRRLTIHKFQGTCLASLLPNSRLNQNKNQIKPKNWRGSIIG